MTFSRIWPTLPPGMRRCGRTEGEKKYNSAMRRTTPEAFEKGLRAYIAGKPDGQHWCYFTTWCNQNRWEVEAEDYDEVERTFDERREESHKLLRKLRIVE